MNGKEVIVPDTNVLIGDPDFIQKIVRNGSNEVRIAQPVLTELRSLKTDKRIGSRARLALKHAWQFIEDEQIKLLNQSMIDKLVNEDRLIDALCQKGDEGWLFSRGDTSILQCILEAKNNGYKSRKVVLATKDVDMRHRASLFGIDVKFIESRDEEYLVESQRTTGMLEPDEEPRPNTFRRVSDDEIMFYDSDLGSRPANLKRTVWNIVPRSEYQSMAIELMLDPQIKIVTIQSEAGFGKSLLALACALTLTRQTKKFGMIHFLKPPWDSAKREIGYLPGSTQEKIGGHFSYLYALAKQLEEARTNSNIVDDRAAGNFGLNPKVITVELANLLRGATRSDTVYILDEAQNLDQEEVRTILSRMGENVKVICLGDVRQIDNPFVNESSNGLNRIVERMAGKEPDYAHFVLQGDRSRGPIADMVRRCRL